VDSPAEPVKRPYHSPRRRQQAERTRRAILDAARHQFLTHGYAGATMAAIAGDAGVTLDAVYKSVGKKPALVLALFHQAVSGEGEVEDTEARADRVSVDEPDPVARLRAFGDFVAEVAPRTAPIALLVHAGAHSDPELAAVWQQVNDERLARMAAHAQRLGDDGHLRSDVTVEEARDVLWVYSSIELYDLMVHRRGWTATRYGRWVADAYIAALLPHQAGERR
jgi:AcrR family transcriptional regulator